MDGEASDDDAFSVGDGEFLRQGRDNLPQTVGVSPTLDSIMYTPALERANRVREMHRLQAELARPLAKLVEQDADAAEAARQLRQWSSQGADAVLDRQFSDGGEASLFIDLPPGLKVLSAPYDYARSAPVYGAGVVVSADPGTGKIQVNIGNDSHYDGGMVGSGAIGLSIVPTRNGTVALRPYIKGGYGWQLIANYLSASIDGRIGFYVEEQNGPRVSNIQEVVLFHQTSATAAEGHQEDEALSFAGDVHFAAQAGRHYIAWFWLTLSGDQSGSQPFIFAWSRALGGLGMELRILGVELT